MQLLLLLLNYHINAILFTFIFLLIPLVYSLPAASPKSGTDFDFNQEIETFVEQAFNQDDPSQAAAAASFEEF